MRCIILIFFSALAALAAAEVRNVRCQPGLFYREYCNTCTCSDDGTKLTCTEKRCGNGEFEKNGQRPYQHFDIQMRRRRSTYYPDENTRCSPGKSFKFECNTCFCTNAGYVGGCTMMECPPMDESLEDSDYGHLSPTQFGRSVSNVHCTPLKGFKIDCNYCMCNADGESASCTRMACVPVENHQRSADGDLPFQDPVFPFENPADLRPRCDQLGQRFYDGCNWCNCGLDGRIELCTFRACDSMP